MSAVETTIHSRHSLLLTKGIKVMKSTTFNATVKKGLIAIASTASIAITIPALVQPAFAGGCTGSAATTSQPTRTAVAPQQASILDVAAANGNFTTLVAAVEAAGLEDTLNSGTFTVFAPTDEAFAALPAGTVENLLKPENRDQLVALLTRHVVADKVTAAMLPDNPTVEALSGETLMPKVSDSGVTINNARVLQADVSASNGVIHVIDSVL
jgi:uncharacterized surface protein with fasciclin (FAS1) repeats